MSAQTKTLRKWAVVSSLLAVLAARLYASDHADPIDLLMLGKPLEPGITDLFVFPRGDQMIVILCVRRALTQRASLNLEPYTYRVFLDLNSTVSFDNDEQLKRYGGTVVRPEDIRPTVTLTFRLNNNATVREHRFEGLPDPKRVRFETGIRDDPFIFPPFFGTNVVAMVVSIPMDEFPAGQRTWLAWAASSDRNGTRQIDHVGRSLRTQNPRFELLNTLPPSQHVAAITREHERPSLMRELFWKRLNLPQLFAYRKWDFVPDVMIYAAQHPVGFPNGRLLTDDVAELLATYGDTLLKELSYVGDNATWPRATKNDKEFLNDFPYLAEPWPDKMVNPPRLSRRNVLKLVAIALTVVALWLVTAFALAWWLERRRLRRRYL